MTSRIAIIVVVAACLFGAGFALAKPGGRPAGTAVDAAPAALALERVDVDAGLTAGTPARLRPAPVRRKPVVKAPVTRALVSQPRAVATPRPVVRTTPAQPVATVAPQPTSAPPPKPQTKPQTPSYVGSGFDDSG